MARRDDDDYDDDTGIEVKTEFFPLAWILYLCTPRIEINGKVHTKAWGTHFFPLDPGKYTVRVYFPYLFQSRCGENSIKVRIREGEVARLSYYMPPLIFMAGTLVEVD